MLKFTLLFVFIFLCILPFIIVIRTNRDCQGLLLSWYYIALIEWAELGNAIDNRDTTWLRTDFD